MTRRQIRHMIFAQATMIGILAFVQGALSGVFIAYMINLSAMPLLGHPISLHFYPWAMLAGLIAAATVVLIAAWIPAERAARLSPMEAIRYE